MNKLKKGGHFGKTRWRPLEGIFGVALTLIFFLLCYQLAMYQVSCFYHKMHDSSQNCYISAPLKPHWKYTSYVCALIIMCECYSIPIRLSKCYLSIHQHSTDNVCNATAIHSQQCLPDKRVINRRTNREHPRLKVLYHT